MNKNALLAFSMLWPLSMSFSASAVDPEAMPMLAPAKSVKTQKDLREEREKAAKPEVGREQIAEQYAKAYEKAGQPSVAIFWNRKFDDQLSQWEQVLRHSITGEAAGKGTELFQKQGDVKKGDVQFGDGARALASAGGPSGEVIGSYERNVSGGAKIVASEYAEVRAIDQDRAGMGEVQDFEFGAGYTETFIGNQTKVVDRQAIMRLVERDNTKEAGAEMIADYQKVETDALVGYADYLAEIVFTPDPSAPLGMSFMVSVKEVGTGQVVAMFKSNGKPPPPAKKEKQWVATSSGYKFMAPNSKPPKLDGQAVGEQLAFETMAKLTKVWSKQ